MERCDALGEDVLSRFYVALAPATPERAEAELLHKAANRAVLL
jgi:hypothetical protein